MEAVAAEFANSQYNDLSTQPWYVRWGICACGLIAGILLIFTSLSDIFNFDIVGMIELGLAVVLICFEVTMLAKAFNFEWCGILIRMSETASPLMRAVIYGGAAIPIICMKGITSVFVLLPCIATGAAYFVLWMDSRKRDDEAPITEHDGGFA